MPKYLCMLIISGPSVLPRKSADWASWISETLSFFGDCRPQTPGRCQVFGQCLTNTPSWATQVGQNGLNILGSDASVQAVNLVATAPTSVCSCEDLVSRTVRPEGVRHLLTRRNKCWSSPNAFKGYRCTVIQIFFSLSLFFFWAHLISTLM